MNSLSSSSAATAAESNHQQATQSDRVVRCVTMCRVEADQARLETFLYPNLIYDKSNKTWSFGHEQKKSTKLETIVLILMGNWLPSIHHTDPSTLPDFLTCLDSLAHFLHQQDGRLIRLMGRNETWWISDMWFPRDLKFYFPLIYREIHDSEPNNHRFLIHQLLKKHPAYLKHMSWVAQVGNVILSAGSLHSGWLSTMACFSIGELNMKLRDWLSKPLLNQIWLKKFVLQATAPNLSEEASTSPHYWHLNHQPYIVDRLHLTGFVYFVSADKPNLSIFYETAGTVERTSNWLVYAAADHQHPNIFFVDIGFDEQHPVVEFQVHTTFDGLIKFVQVRVLVMTPLIQGFYLDPFKSKQSK